MPSNDERREVAENLRNMLVGEWCRYAEQFYELLKETVMDGWDFHEFGDVAERLADLIEPKPERTCKNEEVYWCLFTCSNCGCEVRGGDEYGHNSSHGSFNYCPNCGARVINDAD